MSTRPIVFLDDGGVMNDNSRRAAYWRRNVARYLAPRLGGEPAAWEQANHVVATRLWDELWTDVDPTTPYTPFYEQYEDRWLSDMCLELGIAPPVERGERLRLARETAAYVTRRVRSAFPGAVAAIRRMHAAGVTLNTASGEASWDLDGYLTGMRVRDCFGRLYGPDQVDTLKGGRAYYERIFAHAGVDPRDALVVDDGERVLDAAAEVGARTVLCNPKPPASARHGHVRRLAELPELLGLT